MDSDLSGFAAHAASDVYLVVAVVLPPMLLALIALRVLSARPRWAGWDRPEYASSAWRLPYEMFVIAFPVAATASGEWLAIVALTSGSNRSAGANRLIIATAAGLLIMGISTARSLSHGNGAAPGRGGRLRHLTVDDGEYLAQPHA